MLAFMIMWWPQSEIERWYRQLRTRRALMLGKDVPLRTRRALYSCTKYMAIAPFWFSTERSRTALTPFWLSTDDTRSTVCLEIEYSRCLCCSSRPGNRNFVLAVLLYTLHDFMTSWLANGFQFPRNRRLFLTSGIWTTFKTERRYGKAS